MSIRSTTRRGFLRTTAAGLFAATIARKKLFAQPAPEIRIRKNALLLPSDDTTLQQYAEAVKKMHELSATDRRSWRKQAEIHPNFCQHSTSGFLPWHRHCINEFEKICGHLLGNPNFALPYWDWTTAGGKIPDAFFDINELNVTFWEEIGMGNFPNWGSVDTIGVRALAKGDRAQDDPVRGGNFTLTRINQIKGSATYSLLRQQLEGSPHNSGHVVVGLTATDPPGHMVDGLSPLDPLFYLHHCNVDRIWAEWQLAGNSTPSFGVNYNGQFCDINGDLIDVEADASIDFESLGYSYDTISPFGSPSEFLRLVDIPAEALSPSSAAEPQLEMISEEAVNEPLALNSPFSVQLPTAQLAAKLEESQNIRNSLLPDLESLKTFEGNLKDAVAGYGKSRKVRKSVYLLIEGAQRESQMPPSVNVFLNCPYLTPQTPYTDPHYAGSFSFFGHHDHGEGQDFLVDITNTVEELGVVDEERVNVQLVPITPDGNAGQGTVKIKGVKFISS